MDKHSAWTGGQYSLYRALVGLYLVIHFGMLLPYAGELFAVGGAVTAADQSPYFGLLPNPLAWSDSPIAVAGLLLSALAASLLLLIGWGHPMHALAVLALLALQLVLMDHFLQDVTGRALLYSGFGVPLFVAGMMVSAFALRAGTGGAVA